MKLFPFFLFPFFLFGALNENGDFQVWNTDTLHVKMGRQTTLKGQTEFRYGRDGSKLYYKHYQGGVLFTCSPRTLLEFAYRHTYLRKDHKWGVVYNPLVDLTFQTQSRRGFYIGDRSRLQYLIFDKHLGHKGRWLYRNRLEIIPAVRLTRRKIAPFIADEIFWHEGRGIMENRAEIGLKIPYHQRTQLNLSYLYRNLKNLDKTWIHHNVLWVHFSLHF
ncbi:MAG: DUF2490 domain-containing protein [Chlamydiia bacterium]|nr:DUF2490 domain-containing protein [Chlamydiia bacterium]